MILETTPEAILGKHPPNEAAFYDHNAPENIFYQLSTGERRSVFIECSEEDVFGAFCPLIDFGDMHEDDEIILFRNAGYHRAIFINPLALDYVSLPTHKFEAGSLETEAETLDALGDDDDDPTPAAPLKLRRIAKRKPPETDLQAEFSDQANCIFLDMVRSEGLEPPRFYSLPPQGSASTNSATSALGMPA